MFRTSLIAAAAMAASLTPAFAGERIGYDAASLNDPAFVASLYGQIEDAARTVCRADLRGDALRPYKLDACIDAAVADAVAQVNAPGLTAYADGDISDSRVALLN